MIKFNSVQNLNQNQKWQPFYACDVATLFTGTLSKIARSNQIHNSQTSLFVRVPGQNPRGSTWGDIVRVESE